MKEPGKHKISWDPQNLKVFEDCMGRKKRRTKVL
jgi:hypothetical protein